MPHHDPIGHRRSRALLLVVCLGLLAVVASACGSNHVVVPPSLHAGAVAVPRGLAPPLALDGTLREQVADIIRGFGLPVPTEFSVYVYPTRDRFREGLVRDAHIAPARAAELANFALGVGKRRVLLFNDDGTAGHGREWVRLVSHELTHLAQFELAEGEGRGEQWLAEGLAEWMAFHVLEGMKLDTVARRRRVAESGVHDPVSGEPIPLGLDSLGTSRGFTRRHQHDGALPIYQLSFLMVDYLIERDGLDQVSAYFRGFRESADRSATFERAFGQSLAEFETEFNAHLRTAAHP
jgi:hypothetical protein